VGGHNNNKGKQEAPLPRRAQRVQFWYQSKAHTARLPISD